MDLKTKLGTAMFETHGQLCQELINAGYDLDNYYDGGKAWGDFSRVLVMVAVSRGAGSYDDYLDMFDGLKQADEIPVSRQLFARLTGIRTNSQTQRTRKYRQNLNAELAELRALRWIDDNPVDAISYIRDKFSKLL